MKRSSILLIAAGLMMASACSPQYFWKIMEMRYPSKSGYELGGKTISLVYLQHGDGRDSTFNYAFADAFASHLEAEYFAGAQAVPVYRMEKDAAGNYASRDTMVNIMLDVDCDVLFLVDSPKFTTQEDGSRKVTARLYAYDSMDRNGDAVRIFNKSAVISAGRNGEAIGDVSVNSDIARMLGSADAEYFAPNWKNETYTFVYYDDGQPGWSKVLLLVDDMRWKDALDVLMNLAQQSKSADRRAAAEYDAAICCYMMGYYDLATDWLDAADADYNISNSAAMRIRIQNRQQGSPSDSPLQ